MQQLPSISSIEAKFRDTDGPVVLTPEEAEVVRLDAVRQAKGPPVFNRRTLRQLEGKDKRGQKHK